MRLLLDTHCWLWMETAPERFTPAVAATLADPKSELFLSAASCWELAIKHSLGKLDLPQPPRTYVESRMARNAVWPLPITPQHALEVADLPHHHGDPFDRLLVAQAKLEGLTLLTVDRQLKSYEIEILWANAQE